jgi:hypothetical protein
LESKLREEELKHVVELNRHQAEQDELRRQLEE